MAETAMTPSLQFLYVEQAPEVFPEIGDRVDGADLILIEELGESALERIELHEGFKEITDLGPPLDWTQEAKERLQQIEGGGTDTLGSLGCYLALRFERSGKLIRYICIPESLELARLREIHEDARAHFRSSLFTRPDDLVQVGFIDMLQAKAAEIKERDKRVTTHIEDLHMAVNLTASDIGKIAVIQGAPQTGSFHRAQRPMEVVTPHPSPILEMRQAPSAREFIGVNKKDGSRVIFNPVQALLRHYVFCGDKPEDPRLFNRALLMEYMIRGYEQTSTTPLPNILKQVSEQVMLITDEEIKNIFLEISEAKEAPTQRRRKNRVLGVLGSYRLIG